MNKRALSLFAILVLGLACAELAMIVAPTPVFAAKVPGLSKPVLNLLKESDDLSAKGMWPEALAKAKEAQALPSKTPYDDFTINEVLAKIYINMKDYTNAAVVYEAAWQSGFVKPEEKGTFLNALAQIFYATKDYTKALGYADQYFKEVGDNLDLQAVVANIYYTQKNNAKAFSTVQDLLAKAKLTNTQVKEPWYRLLLYTGSAVKNDAAMKDALFGLVENYPNKDNWHDLAGEFYNQPNKSDHFGLMCFRLMNAADSMRESREYLAMAQLALNVGLAGEARKALESGDASGVLPGKEKTLEQNLKKQASDAAKGEPANLDAKDAQAAAGASGGSDVAIGEAFANYGMYDKAIAAINRGLGKTTLRNPDEARLALGWVQFNAGQYDQAKTTFGAVKTDPRSMDLARAWLALVNQKSGGATPPPANPK